MEMPGIEPGASCMLSTRSTIELHPRYYAYYALYFYYYYTSSTTDHQALDSRGWGTPWPTGHCSPMLWGLGQEKPVGINFPINLFIF